MGGLRLFVSTVAAPSFFFFDYMEQANESQKRVVSSFFFLFDYLKPANKSQKSKYFRFNDDLQASNISGIQSRERGYTLLALPSGSVC